ncbi:hypothetical protein [Bradyrhizobium sp. BRP56]|nr:hypothetical protein [Bradyrhizobium sp. BRP56]
MGLVFVMQLVAGHRRGALARRIETELDPVRASAVIERAKPSVS